MKRLTIRNVMILALSVVFLCITAMSASAIIIPYTDEAAWESDVGSWLTEDFSDITFNSGISINSESGMGTVASIITPYKYKWYDKVVRDQYNTTIGFTIPILAFGGTWDLANPGLEGQGIDVTIFYNLQIVSAAGTISNLTSGEFWGFISSDPFDEVMLAGGGVENKVSEIFTLDDMKYAPVPEPATMLLVGSGLLALGGFRRKFRSKRM